MRHEISPYLLAPCPPYNDSDAQGYITALKSCLRSDILALRPYGAIEIRLLCPAIGGALSDVFVCLSVAYIGTKSRTERLRNTKIGTEIAHVTRDLDTTLLSAALTRKAAATGSVGTYSAWERTATLRLLGGARGAWAPTGEERGRGILCRHTHSLLLLLLLLLARTVLKLQLTRIQQSLEISCILLARDIRYDMRHPHSGGIKR